MSGRGVTVSWGLAAKDEWEKKCEGESEGEYVTPLHHMNHVTPNYLTAKLFEYAVRPMLFPHSLSTMIQWTLTWVNCTCMNLVLSQDNIQLSPITNNQKSKDIRILSRCQMLIKYCLGLHIDIKMFFTVFICSVAEHTCIMILRSGCYMSHVY